MKRQDPKIDDRIQIYDKSTNTYFWAKVVDFNDAWIYAIPDGESFKRGFFRSRCANSAKQHIYS